MIFREHLVEKNKLSAHIIAFIAKEKAKGSDSAMADIATSNDLFADGWLDSLFCLRLLTYIEKEIGVRIPIFQVTRDNFPLRIS